MYNFDTYNVLLSIATNTPQRLKTGFVLQGHIFVLESMTIWIKDFVLWSKTFLRS